MTFLETNFNDEGLEPVGEFTPIPAGEYLMILESDEKVATRDGNNHYLKCVFSIIEGEFKGRKLFLNLNLWHEKENVQNLAWRQLADLKRAVGLQGQMDNTAALHNQPLRAKVVIRPAAKGYDASNNIKMFIPKEGAATQAAAQQVQPGPAQAGSTTPPWGGR